MKNPGRPRKPALERRSVQVSACFRLDEAAQLDLFAAEAGMTTSEFLRTRAFATSAAPAIAPDLKHDIWRLLLAVQRGLHDGVAPAVIIGRLQAVMDRLLA